MSLADKALASLSRAGIFGTYLVVSVFGLFCICHHGFSRTQDYVPALKHIPPWFPGAYFKKQAQEWRVSVSEMVNRPFEMVKQKMVRAALL